MRALVTGGSGFLGRYTARHLAAQGAEVTATYRPDTDVRSGDLGPGIAVHSMDVEDPVSVATAFDAVRPEVVYHFAGKSLMVPSWEDPVGTFETNLFGTLRLLEQIRAKSPGTGFAFAGSGTEYGAGDGTPTPEEAPLRPTSPYAASKCAGDLLCYQYFRSFDIPVYRFRIFGTTGRGKRGDSTNDFASQIADAERGGTAHVLRVGSLDKEIDLLDVRDAVRAMVTVVERGEPGGAYNIGSGTPRSVRSTLDRLVALSRVPMRVEVDPSRIRRVDQPVRVADVTRLRKLGWTPEIPFEQTLDDILDGWRETGESADSGSRHR